MSSTFVDDTDPRFDYKDGAWTAGGEANEFDSTSHSSDVGGAQALFGPFTGTSIAVFSTIDTSQTKVHFFVDDDLQNDDVPAMTISGVQFQQQVYSASNLDPTSTHMLQINLLDPGPFTLDYVVIGNGVTSSTSTASKINTVAITSSTLKVVSAGITTSIPTPTTTSHTFSTTPTFTSGTTTPTEFNRTPAISTTPTSTTPTVTPTTNIINPVVPPSKDPNPNPSALGYMMPSSPTSGNPVVGGTSTPLMAGGTSTPLMAVARGPDTTVIGSVTGAIVCFAVIVVSLFSGPPRLMPIAPAFLADDPTDSPVFDIKQRPASGSTMTTRVTVGTSIGQRASVPDFGYKYPYPETPIPAVPPLLFPRVKGAGRSPSDTGTSSATGTDTQTMTFGASNAYLTATSNPYTFPSPTERGAETAGSHFSSSRPLPYTPTEVKSSAANQNMQNHRFLPTTPSVFERDAETVIHEDGGVRLAPKRELPPPYADYGV
ncbi:hypothetical protein EW145_g205 [Phellinidium pouzarii]|uniref:Uncharacterized protein n=1 Tax=Phellinidium pouzarii TaxID=167371 RepID=A0A4S4LJC5_9AGAM|nr:hypothetical protein EW145_g205 [Phellinidium pouzarii]